MSKTEKTYEQMTMPELRNEASLLGISYKANMSKNKLIELIQKAKEEGRTEEVGTTEEEDFEKYMEDVNEKQSTGLTKKEIKELKENALLMIKVRITDMDPESQEQTAYAGVVTNYFKAARYIPLGKVWYVENCLIDALSERKFQTFVDEIDPKTRRPTGNKKPVLRKRYNIEYIR
jgi:hypothetical protein